MKKNSQIFILLKQVSIESVSQSLPFTICLRLTYHSSILTRHVGRWYRTNIYGSKINQAASKNLLKHLMKLQKCFRQWIIIINDDNSTLITLTLRCTNGLTLFINNIIIPKQDTIIYLYFYLDKKLNWINHIITKGKMLNIWLHTLKHLLR